MSQPSPPGRFGYRQVLKSDESGQVTSMIAFRFGAERTLQAVIWAVHRNMWMYAPAIAAQFLFDPEYSERAEQIDRPTAERIAQAILKNDLPSEETLAEMCEEGDRMDWDLGPPEQ